MALTVSTVDYAYICCMLYANSIVYIFTEKDRMHRVQYPVRFAAAVTIWQKLAFVASKQREILAIRLELLLR